MVLAAPCGSDLPARAAAEGAGLSSVLENSLIFIIPYHTTLYSIILCCNVLSGAIFYCYTILYYTLLHFILFSYIIVTYIT